MTNNNDIKELFENDPLPEHATGFFENLEHQIAAAPINSSVLRRHRISVISTGAVAAAALALFATTTLTSTDSGKSTHIAAPSTTGASTSSTSTASSGVPNAELKLSLIAQIRERALARYANVTSISGTLTGRNSVTKFKARDDGSFLALGGYGDTSYNATTGEYRSVSDNDVLVWKDSFLYGGMDYYGGFSPSNLLNGLTLDENPNVEETTLDGKKVWKIQSRLTKPITGLGNLAPTGLSEIVAYYDQESMFPVRIEAGGYITTLSDLKLNETFTDEDLMLPAREGLVKDSGYSPGYKRMTIEEIAAATKRPVVLPTSLPEGFVQGTTAYSADLGVMEISYHRGIEAIRYTVDFNGVGTKKGDKDPWYNLNETNATHEDYTVKGGAYNDLHADIVASPATKPHVTVVGATSTLYVGGDTTTDDLKTLLNSIHTAN